MPDLSKWNTDNTVDISGIFNNCSSLLSLPDISKWKTHNIINMSSVFSSCKSLKILRDISKWNTANVINMGVYFIIAIYYHFYLIYLDRILKMLRI